jgi:hypothetical protein
MTVVSIAITGTYLEGAIFARRSLETPWSSSGSGQSDGAMLLSKLLQICEIPLVFVPFLDLLRAFFQRITNNVAKPSNAHHDMLVVLHFEISCLARISH